MSLLAVVIAQHDHEVALGLANNLRSHFDQVSVLNSGQELRAILQRNEARLAVLDLELVALEEVRKLSQTLQNLTIVCTHRSPDEQMWAAALAAGAFELCHPCDIPSILRASRDDAKGFS